MGIAVSEIKADEYGLVKRSGLIKNANWQLAAGEVYYLGLDGELTDKEPKNKLAISVGVAFAVDSLSIRIVDV